MNTHLFRTGIIALSIVTITSIAHAAFDPQSWPVSRPLDTHGQSGMVKAILPTDIKWGTEDFRDIRLIDGANVEIPYLITRSIISSSPTANARLLDHSSLPDGTTRFIADTGQGGVVHTGITITTPTPNFRRQVSVYASNTLRPLDDAGWSLVTATGYIFSYTDPYSGYTSGRGVVNFPANTSRYFKVLISGGPEGPIVINGSALTSDVSVETRSYREEHNVEVYNNPTKKSTEIVLDLGISGRLTDEVTLNVSSSNYSRRVIIEVSDDRYATSSWRFVSQGSISGVSTSVFQGYSNTIGYPEQQSRYIRISVVNDDNPPLTIVPKVSVSGSVLSLIFEAQTGKSYSLYYGNKYANKPNYDIGRLSSYIDEKNLPQVSIGQEIANAEYIAPTGPVVPYTESHKGLLNGLLVVVVIIIGAAIALYLRMYMKKHTPSPESVKPFVGGTENDNYQ